MVEYFLIFLQIVNLFINFDIAINAIVDGDRAIVINLKKISLRYIFKDYEQRLQKLRCKAFGNEWIGA